jgi:hypothetical protein
MPSRARRGNAVPPLDRGDELQHLPAVGYRRGDPARRFAMDGVLPLAETLHHAGRWRRRLGRRAGERPAVEADPTLPDHSRRLRARRHGRVRDGSVSTFPGFPPVAMQQGRCAARAARARLQGRARRPSGTKTKAIWPPSAAPRQSRTSRAAPSALQGDGSAPLPSSTALGRALVGHKTDSCAQIPGDPDYSRAIRPHRFLGPCRIFARAAPHRRRRESHLRSKRPQVRILPGALSESPA